MLLLVVVSSPAQALALTNGYFTNDTQIKTGMTVSQSSETTAEKSFIERARISEPAKIIGVAVRMEDGLLTVASQDSQIYVATSGEVQAYVLDINGAIKKGDSLAISPVRGILMKADANTTGLTGTALEDFNTENADTIQVESDGNNQSAKLGRIKINIALNAAGAIPTEGQSYFERLGQSLTKNKVSEVQILAAFVIFLVLLVVEGGLMYGAISSTITSLGRNPYSKRLIYIAFLRSLGLAVLVLLLGLGAMYLVLRF